MDLKFEIKGLDGVLKRMRTLAPKLQKKGLRAAARKGANIFRDAARRNYEALGVDDPETAVNIARRIIVAESGREGKKEGGVVMRVGVAGGAKLSRAPDSAAHWRLIELGREGVAAKPFMRPAMESNIDRATTAVVDELNVQLDKLTNAP